MQQSCNIYVIYVALLFFFIVSHCVKRRESYLSSKNPFHFDQFEEDTGFEVPEAEEEEPVEIESPSPLGKIIGYVYPPTLGPHHSFYSPETTPIPHATIYEKGVEYSRPRCIPHQY